MGHLHNRRAAVISAACLAAIASSEALALPAFPGAEGFGANAQGGRGGDIYHVTTLAADPDHLIPGSLSYGAYYKNVPAAGRTIVFDVGGVINLGSSSLDIKEVANLTIAGQTAPTPITIIGNTMQITGNNASRPTHDVIARYLTLRKGTGTGEDALSIKGSANTHDIIVDHISGSWSEDEVISVTQSATNVTVQYSMMSEALTESHAYGALIRPDVNSSVTYSHNLFSNQKSRNPRPGTYDGMTLNLEFQNNVVYNWSDRAGYIAGADDDTQYLNMNYVGNYLIAGPSTSGTVPQRRTTAFIKEVNSDPLALDFWQEQNLIDATAGTTRDGVDTGWGMFQTLTGSVYSAFPEADKASARFAFPMDNPDSATDAYGKVISSVGAFPYARSTTDQRLINDVLNYTGTAPVAAPPTSEWNALLATPTTTRPAGWDTDGDGMPNYWENLRGTNPSAADNNGMLSGDGYTNIENYINSLTFIANWNLNGNGNWSQHLNWRGTRPSSNLATANFVSGNLAPVTVTLDQAVTLSDLNFDSANSYTLADGGFALTMNAVSGRATISVVAGSHTIAAAVALSDDVDLTITPPNGQLSFTGPLTGAGKTLKKLGAGTAQFQSVRTGGLNVTAGQVQISTKGSANSASGTSVVSNLSIASGASLDLTNNSMIIDYADPSNDGDTALTDSIRQHLQDGRITSTSATAGHRLGYGDNFSLGNSSFAGQDIDTSSLLVKFTYAGDTNLDGQVTIADLGDLASNWQSTAAVWQNGDFNYDGQVTIADLGDLASNWQAGVGSPLGMSFSEALAAVGFSGTVVPEPSSGVLIGLTCAGLMIRRRGGA